MDKIISLTDTNYFFYLTLGFYFLILVANPSSKIILLLFILLLFVINYKLRNIKTSLFFIFLISLVLFTGKTYPIQLLPVGVFPIEILPLGYFVHLVIKPQDIISFFMFVIIIREYFVNRGIFVLKKIILPDILILAFFVCKIVSAFYSSQIPQISLIFEVLSAVEIIAYFYIKHLLKIDKNFINIFVSVLSALVLFQSILSIAQLINKSPLYKNIESQVNIEYYGKAIDETEFTFRPLGTYGHANALGIWITTSILFLIPFAIKNKSIKLWFSIILGFFALEMTLSRSAWIGFLAGSIYLYYKNYEYLNYHVRQIYSKHKKTFYVFFSISLLIVIYFVVPRLQKSIYSFGIDSGAMFFRNILIKDAIQLITINPIFGIGTYMSIYEGISLNLYTVAASIPLAVHNWYVSTALETGVLSLVLYILFVASSIKRYWYTRYIDSPIGLGITAVTISIIFIGLFQSYINSIFVLMLLSISNNDIITFKDVKKSKRI